MSEIQDLIYLAQLYEILLSLDFTVCVETRAHKTKNLAGDIQLERK